MSTHENKSQPFLVTILASAISSVGYGVSIFAIGIIWLLPSVKPAVPVQVLPKRKHNHRRRSAPPVLGPPLPSLLNTTSKSSPDSPRSRRVYFADSPVIQSASSSLTFQRQMDFCDDSLNILPLDASPRSSSSTLVHTSHNNDSRVPDASFNSDPTESDRSSSSFRQTPRFPGRITVWNRKVSNHKPSNDSADLGAEANYSDETSTEISIKDRRRTTSLSFSWSISKSKSSPETTTVVASSSPLASPSQARPSTAPGIVSLVRTTKHQRRVSAPVRERTQPYAYPYFAMPPDQRPSATVVDSSQESLERPGTAASFDSKRLAVSDQRRQNAEAQATLGLGHKRPPQRRATSEGFMMASA
ncbi:hypothetical protein GYMLUDRAFT_253980 [Collybiopsis luxurians FD-317 M1]|nr:hypothetical protein GYMLUDRAFT_253980 [Collybiopsis luxurians FD-317 M1]